MYLYGPIIPTMWTQLNCVLFLLAATASYGQPIEYLCFVCLASLAFLVWDVFRSYGKLGWQVLASLVLVALEVMVFSEGTPLRSQCVVAVGCMLMVKLVLDTGNLILESNRMDIEV